MANVKETKELIYFVLALGNAAGKSLEDGKVSWTDLLNFFQAFKSANDAFAGVEKIKAELNDLDKTELEEIKTYVGENFDIPQDEIEEYIEKALFIGLDIMGFVLKFYEKKK